MGASGPQTQPLSNSGTVLLDTQWAYAHYGRSLSEAVEYYGCCMKIYIQHGVISPSVGAGAQYTTGLSIWFSGVATPQLETELNTTGLFICSRH